MPIPKHETKQERKEREDLVRYYQQKGSRTLTSRDIDRWVDRVEEAILVLRAMDRLKRMQEMAE